VIGGSDELRARFLPRLADARAPAIGAMALTEPEAGSDVMSMRTTARADGDAYVLNGKKHFITNGGVADLTVVFAKTDPAAGYAGVSAFVVEKGTPGLSSGAKMRKLGIRASHTGEVVLEDCRVPRQNLIGGEGAGFLLAMKALEASRPLVAAGAVGVARAAYEFARDYARQRVQFGRPIFDKQAVAFMLADMATRIEASRLLVWRAACQVDRGESASAAGSMAKLMAGDTAVEVATNAVQILGGYGYSRDFPVEKWFRDAKIMQIYEGTQQIQRLVLSQLL
jgi:alkylation response protein AidB-like acyl-CoA dehydrogenase